MATNIKKSISSRELTDLITELIYEKKGEDVVVIDLKTIPSAVADFFVVCHGNSNTQVAAIASHIEKETRVQVQERPTNKEGHNNSLWILLDYFSVVVHVFYKETREFYDIESLWADAEVESIKEIEN